MKKLIIILSIIAIILILIVLVASQKEGAKEQFKSQTRLTAEPTVDVAQTNTFVVSPTLAPIQILRLVEQARELPKLTTSQAEAYQSGRQKMPVNTNDFDADYSPVVDKYFFAKKTAGADTAINAFLADNNLASVYQEFPELFVITNEPLQAALQKAEEEIYQARQLKFQSRQQVQGAHDQQSSSNPLMRLLQILFGFDTSAPIGKSGPSTGGGGQPGTPGDISSLEAIFAEAGTRIGTPPSLLKSIMQIECGPLLSLPSDKITEYSTPNQGLPPSHLCFFNGVAYGPMQFIPSTWAAYASTVNSAGGYTHESYVQNIRDSVYAASQKLNNDAGNPTSATNWTQEQVYSAARAYYGACSDSYINYCETAWQNYLNNR